ncbi:hypothetical protein PF005_g13498 [Phytophthora fragariae]|uniref:Uncharacterized protein n=2 Tax=Phytophthora TaxID=4783 RepID=A0A6A3EZ91_9STRA|nr:hypothetical protein PF003_g23085 [Phytophthora fragariae]KAE9030674.1 hypothetical protein PR002_g9825 [Phytophthora rubi]KAE8936680.1 hypothetical protein PF009_g13409 [Phytophthora fragariae]KAE9005787.1 hypothetical protein PF011_g11883 [Phytophthora fragariae]KAE9034448.1 hypothetical protein PR001_g9725 [Phytophthora rubi]
MLARIPEELNKLLVREEQTLVTDFHPIVLSLIG